MRKVTHARKRNAWADRDKLLHWCRGPRRNHVCRFVLRSITGFGRGGGSNFGFLHWLASSPLQHSRTTVRVCDTPNHHVCRNTTSKSQIILGQRDRIKTYRCIRPTSLPRAELYTLPRYRYLNAEIKRVRRYEHVKLLCMYVVPKLKSIAIPPLPPKCEYQGTLCCILWDPNPKWIPVVRTNS